MKRFIGSFVLSICCIFSALTPVQARAEEAPITQVVHEEREAFARKFAETVVSILYDQKKNYEDRKDVLRRAFAKSVDIDWIAKFVLGKTWRDANDEQRERYTELYRQYLTESYVSNFAENPDKRISDIKVTNVSDGVEDRFTVRTQMKLVDQEQLSVSYLVQEKEKRYKVLDIAIENVSLTATHRAEFGALAAKKGVAGVIAKLEELTSKPSEMTLSMK